LRTNWDNVLVRGVAPPWDQGIEGGGGNALVEPDHDPGPTETVGVQGGLQNRQRLRPFQEPALDKRTDSEVSAVWEDVTVAFGSFGEFPGDLAQGGTRQADPAVTFGMSTAGARPIGFIGRVDIAIGAGHGSPLAFRRLSLAFGAVLGPPLAVQGVAAGLADGLGRFARSCRSTATTSSGGRYGRSSRRT